MTSPDYINVLRSTCTCALRLSVSIPAQPSTSQHLLPHSVHPSPPVHALQGMRLSLSHLSVSRAWAAMPCACTAWRTAAVNSPKVVRTPTPSQMQVSCLTHADSREAGAVVLTQRSLCRCLSAVVQGCCCMHGPCSGLSQLGPCYCSFVSSMQDDGCFRP